MLIKEGAGSQLNRLEQIHEALSCMVHWDGWATRLYLYLITASYESAEFYDNAFCHHTSIYTSTGRYGMLLAGWL